MSTHAPATDASLTRRPAIGHVLHRLYLAGAEVLAADLARQMRQRYRFVFLCLDEAGPLGSTLEDQGFDVVNLGRKPGIDSALARRLRQAVVQHGIALLHAHQYTPFFYAALSRGFYGLSWNVPRPAILFTEHGRHYPDHRSAKHVAANRLLLNKCDRVTAVGRWVAQALSANEGIAASRVEVVYNGIDPARFTTDSSSSMFRTRARAELGLREDQAVCLQVARFHPVKDHSTSIRAWQQVARQVPHAVLLLAGDGEKREQAQALAAQLGLENTVRFLGVRDDVPRLMAAADAFVLSSLSEGISVTLLEAMGCGLPIAATHVGGNAEVVEHGVSGLLSPRGDAPALAVNIISLLSDPLRQRAMGQAGRATLLAKFTQAQMHGRYEAIYQQMLGDKSRGPG